MDHLSRHSGHSRRCNHTPASIPCREASVAADIPGVPQPSEAAIGVPCPPLTAFQLSAAAKAGLHPPLTAVPTPQPSSSSAAAVAVPHITLLACQSPQSSTSAAARVPHPTLPACQPPQPPASAAARVPHPTLLACQPSSPISQPFSLSPSLVSITASSPFLHIQ